MFSLCAYLNVSLAVFNLIPLPPFDGSRIFYSILPAKLYFSVMKYERYILIVFLALLYTGIVSLPIGYITNFIIGLFNLLFGLIFGIGG
jgi:Zn-dependent protease